MGQINTVLKYSAYVILISLITPWIFIGSVSLRIDYIAIILSLPFLLIVINQQFSRLSFMRVIVYVSITLFFIFLVSNSLGYASFRNQILLYFPTEWIQIMNRGACAILFYYIGFYDIIRKKDFFRFVTVVFLISLLFGVIQIIGVSSLSSFFSLYATSDNQLRLQNNTVNRRIFGSVGHSIGWGGLCIFIFYYFYLLLKKSLVRIVGIAFAVAGILFSGSKSAIISFAASLLICTIYRSFQGKNKAMKLTLGVIYAAIVLLLANYILLEYFPAHHEFLLFRFSKLDESLSADSYGGRGYRLDLLINLMKTDPLNLALGIGKPLLYEITGFIEIEFFHLLGCYGLVGVFFHYYLLYYLCKRSITDRLEPDHRTFIIVTTIAYIIFSIGFYFFRELGVGLYYWIMAGYLIGINHRKNHLLSKAI